MSTLVKKIHLDFIHGFLKTLFTLRFGFWGFMGVWKRNLGSCWRVLCLGLFSLSVETFPAAQFVLSIQSCPILLI